MKINKHEYTAPQLPKYSWSEVNEMRDQLKGFTQKRIDGRLVSREDQLFVEKKLIRLDKGLVVVIDVHGYNHAKAVMTEVDKIEYAIRKRDESIAPPESQEKQEVFVKRICRKCTNTLPPHLQNYCSGICMQAARDDGSYGREDESEEERKEREERLATLA